MQHSASIGSRQLIAAKQSAPISWPAVYCTTTFVLWVVAPFLRRLVDWRSTFTAISPIAALPLFMLVPAILMAWFGRKRDITRSFELSALLWALGFGYALIVGCLDGQALGALYTFAQFVLPLGFGFWIATSADGSTVWYRRVSNVAIVLAVIAGIYGIVQYVILPPWDKQWMLSIAMGSNGYPFPFRFRVFSLLNAPAAFAIFLAVATIMFLPRLTLKNAILLVPVFVGLALSFIRQAWVIVVLGIIVYAALTTRRAIVLKGVSAFIGVGVLAIVLSSVLTTSSTDVATRFADRLLTLGDIANDASAVDRARQISEAYAASIADPEGSGLGAVGVATRFGSTEQVGSSLDSGYLARFLEMGVPGVAAFLASLFVALAGAIRAWRLAVQEYSAVRQDMAAIAIAMQIVMLMLNLFSDADLGLGAIVMWVSLGLVLRAPMPGKALG